MNESFYSAFEARHRGPRQLIKCRLQAYLPFLEPLYALDSKSETVDLGCGRGEWLELLTDIGFKPKGVDLDDGMLKACREIGLDVELGDAFSYLTALPTESQTIVTAFHFVEHVSFEQLQILVKESLRVLKPGGLLILETPNPENILVATRNFYLDPTHQKPIPPDLLSFTVEHAGFAVFKTLRLQESKDLLHKANVTMHDVFAGVSPDYAVVAQKQPPKNMQNALANAFSQQYGLSLDQLLNRWETRFKRSEAKADQALAFAEQAILQLQVVHLSASWRVTLPLRWASNQINLLRTRGFKYRAKDLAKKILRFVVACIKANPKLKQFGFFIINRLGGQELILRFQSVYKTESEGKMQKITRLMPRARSIFADLKTAVV
jgi:O-antigen chain-terminating methyltransferase